MHRVPHALGLCPWRCSELCSVLAAPTLWQGDSAAASAARGCRTLLGWFCCLSFDLLCAQGVKVCRQPLVESGISSRMPSPPFPLITQFSSFFQTSDMDSIQDLEKLQELCKEFPMHPLPRLPKYQHFVLAPKFFFFP